MTTEEPTSSTSSTIAFPPWLVARLDQAGTYDEARAYVEHLAALVDEHGREQAVEIALDEELDELAAESGLDPFAAAIYKARMRSKFYELAERKKDPE